MSAPYYADYQTVAASLREIADKIESVSGLSNPYVRLDIQPGALRRGDDDATVAAIDTVARALFGYPGETVQMSGGSYHHSANGSFPGLQVDVYNAVSPPEVRKLRAEIDELRRQRDELAGGEPQGGAS